MLRWNAQHWMVRYPSATACHSAIVAGVRVQVTSSMHGSGMTTSEQPLDQTAAGAATKSSSGPVDLVRMSPGDVVRAALDRDQLTSSISAGQARRGRFVREDPVLGAMHDQHRHVDLRQVASEVGQPCVDARVRRVRRLPAATSKLACQAGSLIRSGMSVSTL